MKPAFPFIALALFTATAAATAAPPQLRLGQELLPPDSGRLLPAGESGGMTLRLQATFDCGMPDAEAGLFVSVANSATTAKGAKSPQPVVLNLPESQLRGVRESLACPGNGPHLFRGQLTAFATLICRAGDGAETVATVSRPVDLWVECEEPAEEAAEDPAAELAEERADDGDAGTTR
ncbi:MAG: hypothetical protein JSV45_10470 [Chromatiales bacterium]|nr:MAG: hypothetical protein JSV45_10470 [Chromatiales bacterium]